MHPAFWFDDRLEKRLKRDVSVEPAVPCRIGQPYAISRVCVGSMEAWLLAGPFSFESFDRCCTLAQIEGNLFGVGSKYDVCEALNILSCGCPLPSIALEARSPVRAASSNGHKAIFSEPSAGKKLI